MGPQLVDMFGALDPLSMALNQALSRHPSRGTLMGLNSWHAKTSSVNQDLSCHSLYLLAIYHADLAKVQSSMQNGMIK